MTSESRTFGKPRDISGAAVTVKATLIPNGMVQRMKMHPLPLTFTSTTFVINASADNPVFIWVGNDLFMLEENLTYTWSAGANNTILNSSGEVVASQSPATGGWYFYIGIVISATTGVGSFVLYPSQTAPNEATLNHPGASKVRNYAYVGYQICSAATTPAFVDCTKVGYNYLMPDNTLTVATTNTWAEADFSAGKALPKHASLGLTVSGHMNSGAGQTVSIGGTSSATTGIFKVGDSTATGDQFAPFSNLTPSENGKIWMKDSGARGDVTVTIITDIV